MAVVAMAAAVPLTAAPVINEFMYHPLSSVGSPEDSGKEWVELYNPGGTAVDVSGWRLTRGVTFTIPAGTVMGPGGYLVIAADVVKFGAANPGFGGVVVGGWVGTLASGGEEVQLADAGGVAVDDVTYADEGGWATRVRSVVSFGHQGWEWEAAHDGGGHTLAKVLAGLPTLEGQNWKVSVEAGGTPGRKNWEAEPVDGGYFATGVKHTPVVPKAGEPIRVKANLPLGGITNRVLRWRVAGAADFEIAPFIEDGAAGAVSWPGVAVIPGQVDGTVIEYYVDTEAGGDLANDTVPRKARTTAVGVVPEVYENVCNYLVRVDDSFDGSRDATVSANQPLLRLVMLPVDRAELTELQTTSGQEDSTATFNCAFVSQDGTGVKIVQNAGVRNRGFSSALGPPNNFHISFRSDDEWKGRSAVQLNCQFGYSQVLGKTLFAAAGLASHDAVVVQLRVNGADLAEAGGRMYGRYAMLEGRGGEWASNHYPDDADGNFYRADDHEPGAVGVPPGNLGSGEFQYEGASGAAYSDTFFKETNRDADDYSDLVALTRVLSAPVTGGTAEQPAISDAAYPAAVAGVLDIDQFYRYIACDALVGNQEGGLQSGRADDFSLYRGVTDPRFRFVPHDLDDVFDIGNGAGNPVTRSLFSYDEFVQAGNTGVVGLRRMFNHPALLPRYYAAVLEAMERWFNRATIDPLVDRLMAGWVPVTDGSAAAPNRGIQEIKGFVDARRANVLAQIPQVDGVAVAGNAADSVEGYKVSTNGAVNFSGSFNVARTSSITVNGVLAQVFHRTSGADAVGTWKLPVAAGGGGVLRRGLNTVVVRFWDGVGGSGAVVREEVVNVLWNAAPGTTVNGTLTAPGSLTLTAPENYVPGTPVLVRVDLRDGSGNFNRSAWNTTVSLAASNGVLISPSTVTLYNGVGSALVTIGGGGATTQTLLSYGTGGTGAAGSGTAGSVWRAKTDFTVTTLAAFILSSGTTWREPGFVEDATWVSRAGQTGYGDNDENAPFARVDYNPAAGGTQSSPVYLFRGNFTIADLAAVTAVTGQVRFDDSCVVYVNGTQIYRHGDLTANAPLTQYTADNGAPTRENATAALTVPLGLLTSGVNTIAVEVHQADAASSDVTFDLRLAATVATGAADPGPFTLTATVGPLSAGRAVASLGTGAGTTVSGVLPAGTTTWSGLVRVSGDVTVPAGGVLELAAGTQVLMAGTSGAGDTGGADLIVNGSLVVSGTAAQPVSITCADAGARWGQILLSGGGTSTINYGLITRGGHSPGVGHTSRGPVLRLTGSALTVTDSALGDAPGKALYTSGTSSFTMRRSLMARCITGPEVEDGCAVLVEDSNIQECLPLYRESNANVPDDEDCFYLHNGSGRPMDFRRTVFARCGDDVLDCLGGPVNVEDCILREGWDKGISLLNNNLTMVRTQIIDCDKCVAFKNGSSEATRTVTMVKSTLVAEEHDTALAPWGYAVPPTSPDPDIPATAFWTQWKPVSAGGTPTQDGVMVMNASSSIFHGKQPVQIDNGAGQYTSAPTTLAYCVTFDTDTAGAAVWPGTGNLSVDPQFAGIGADDYRLAAGSPCINAGDPDAAQVDPDGSRADIGALPTGTGGGGAIGEVRWTLAGSPYRVTANTTVPTGTTLRIDGGVNVQFDQNIRMTVNGRIVAEGTAGSRVVFSHVPGTNVTSDVDPIKLGTQTGAPKWGGLRVYDSMGEENAFRFCDFVNGQGTSPSGSENFGSLGFIRSWGWVDHCTFAGTHLRMCYGRNSKLTVTYSDFPDMFIFDPLVNRIEEPTTDFIAAADNSMEPLKVEYPTTDAEVSGANAVNFPNGMPLNGWWRVYFNAFHGNRGHQDVFDCDSGRWSPHDPVTNFQTNGQFVIDCRYNHFYGLAGDEHMDLGGDAYIASNVFENARKDFWTNDTGYSNAISSGDKGSGTTIMLARNICYDLDHVINCKLNTATIFEHNTIGSIHPDYVFRGETVTQSVVCAPINFFIPQDGTNPSYGDGAYVGFNIISNVPRLFSGPDARKVNNVVVNDITTKIEFFHNLLDQVTDPVIGPNHPGGYFSGTYGPNQAGAPGFVDPVAEDYGLRMDSLARATAPGGISYGAQIPEWAYVVGGPSGTVADASASFTVGGPGVVAYKWRLDGGGWSAPVQIGSGGVMPRGAVATVRQSVLAVSGLAAGSHVLEVLGQDMAGNWQGSDPARLYDGGAQALPTVREWRVETAVPVVVLGEVMGDTFAATPTAEQQYVELVNRSGAAVDLTGWGLSDSVRTPGEQALTGSLGSGGLLKVSLVNFRVDQDGDAAYLFDAGGVLRDSVVFGPLPAGYALARVGASAEWRLAVPTAGEAVNVAARMSDSSQIVINEWLAATGLRFQEDWIELANLAPYPASLSGLVLTDARFGTAPAFPPLSFIGGGGYVKLVADGDVSAGASHASFRIDSLTAELLLYGAGGEMLDSVRTFPQVTDVSQGRVESGGTGGLGYFTLPTAGAANGTSDPGYLNAVEVLDHLRITEIMYAPEGGNGYEYLELVNTGTVELELGGVRFVQGISFTFPPGFRLAAGAEVLLVRDRVAFEARYGKALPVAGVYDGALDNNGETLALRLPSPWDANILWFRYESTWAETNGTGYSLELVSRGTAFDQFGERTSWKGSAEKFGTPGGWTAPPLTGLAAWLAANGLTMAEVGLDGDGDGLVNTLEYALGTNPKSAAVAEGAGRLPVVGAGADGALTFGFDLGASALPGGYGSEGVTYEVVAGSDLAGWSTVARKLPGAVGWTDGAGAALVEGVVTVVPMPGGLVRNGYHDVRAVPVPEARYLRLRAVVVP